MPPASNEKLKKLISQSAIKSSLVPVIICGENFKVCMKSAGAAKLISKPSAGGSVLPHLPDGTAEKIAAGDTPHGTLFGTPDGEIFAVVTNGTVEGENYYALIFEQGTALIQNEIPGYIAESYRHLSDAVNELLHTSEKNFSRLERSVAAMCRLTDFFGKKSSDVMPERMAYTDVYRELAAVVDGYSELLSTVGAAINLRRLSNEPQVCACPTEAVHAFFSVLIAAALMISSDGYAEISCDAKDSHAVISMDILADGNEGEIESFEDLAIYAASLRLELAAIIDMAEHYGFGLICRSDGKKLCIGCEIETRKSAAIQLHAPVYDGVSEGLRRMIAELFGIVIENKRF